jgi:hypothetical protein
LEIWYFRKSLFMWTFSTLFGMPLDCVIHAFIGETWYDFVAESFSVWLFVVQCSGANKKRKKSEKDKRIFCVNTATTKESTFPQSEKISNFIALICKSHLSMCVCVGANSHYSLHFSIAIKCFLWRCSSLPLSNYWHFGVRWKSID